MPKTRSKPAQDYRAYAALLTTTALWGIAGPIIKLTVTSIPVLTTLFYRFLVVCLIALPFLAIELKKNPINKKDFPNLFILGLLSQTALLVIFYGYKLTTAQDAALISVTYPIIAIAAGRYFYKEKVTALKRIGVIIATIGTLIVIFEPIVSGNHQITEEKSFRILGNLLVLCYQVIWLIYIVWSKNIMGESSRNVAAAEKMVRIKRVTKSYSPTLITLFTFFVGLICFMPLAILENIGAFGRIQPYVLDTTPILGILYLAILSSVVAYALFQWGLHKLAVGDAALFTYLGPVFAFPAAYILLKEVPTSTTLLGGMIVATGVVIAEVKKS